MTLYTQLQKGDLITWARDLRFVCRVKGGSELETLAIASKRIKSAWLPFTFESYKPRKAKEAKAVVKPVMPYLFCQGSAEEMLNLQAYKHVYGPVWHCTDAAWRQISSYKAHVANSFNDQLNSYLTDTTAFHCQYEPGQRVQLKSEGMELFPATFKALHADGHLNLDVEMMGRTVPVKAPPHKVSN